MFAVESEAGGSTDSSNGSEEYIRECQEQIKQLRRKINITLDTTIPKGLADALIEFMWDLKYLNAEWSYYRRILNDLEFHFGNDALDGATKGDSTGYKITSEFPSDIQELLEHKPTEVISDKCTQILLLLCTGSIDRSYSQVEVLKNMVEKQIVKLHNDNYVGFSFLGRTLECFINFVTGQNDRLVFGDPSSDKENASLDIQELAFKSRIVISVAKCLLGRHLHCDIGERLRILKEATVEDPANCEWFLTRAEMWRKKRRETRIPGGRRPTEEELEVVSQALTLEPENPLVQLNVLEYIIDCLREYKGEFRCGALSFESTDETIQYLRDTSKKLLETFSNSVTVNSKISDYFCRFVPFRYFDIPFAESCLERAYQLNPNNPKTTHRLGIFHRMSKGDLQTSYNWFKKTVELDPMHFNATIECIKNKLSKPVEEQVVHYIETLIRKPVFGSESIISCWTEHEIVELLFYKGLGHFSNSDYEKALEVWKIVAEKDDSLFRLTDLDTTGGFYNWNDELISTDRLRIWVNEERTLIRKLESAQHEEGDSSGTKKSSLTPQVERKNLIELLFSLMIGGGYPTKRCRNSGPFIPSPTYQLLCAKITKAGGDVP